MFTVSFNYFGKPRFAPKSHILLKQWQYDIKKAKLFETEIDANKYAALLLSLNDIHISDINVTAL